MSTRRIPIAVIACSVFEKEIALLAAEAGHIADIRFVDMDMHDRPPAMGDRLQAEIDALDSRRDIEAIVLAYGLCGRGTVGLHSVRHKLVIPRAHDCIALFLGSSERYHEHGQNNPGTFYYTPGWNRDRRVPGPDRLKWMRDKLSRQYDREDVEFLLESEREQWNVYNQAAFIDPGIGDTDEESRYANHCARWLGWDFKRIDGDPGWLRDLLWCNWDEKRFLTLSPKMRVRPSTNGCVLMAEPVATE